VIISVSKFREGGKERISWIKTGDNKKGEGDGTARREFTKNS
jgi:hypothetical protein